MDLLFVLDECNGPGVPDVFGGVPFCDPIEDRRCDKEDGCLWTVFAGAGPVHELIHSGSVVHSLHVVCPVSLGCTG